MVVVSNVEIIGKPKYRPIKVHLGDELKLLNLLKSKEPILPLTYSDLVYERDVIDENLTTHRDI
jgi:hypothetical protein